MYDKKIAIGEIGKNRITVWEEGWAKAFDRVEDKYETSQHMMKGWEAQMIKKRQDRHLPEPERQRLLNKLKPYAEQSRKTFSDQQRIYDALLQEMESRIRKGNAYMEPSVDIRDKLSKKYMDYCVNTFDLTIMHEMALNEAAKAMRDLDKFQTERMNIKRKIWFMEVASDIVTAPFGMGKKLAEQGLKKLLLKIAQKVAVKIAQDKALDYTSDAYDYFTKPVFSDQSIRMEFKSGEFKELVKKVSHAWTKEYFVSHGLIDTVGKLFGSQKNLEFIVALAVEPYLKYQFIKKALVANCENMEDLHDYIIDLHSKFWTWERDLDIARKNYQSLLGSAAKPEIYAPKVKYNLKSPDLKDPGQWCSKIPH